MLGLTHAISYGMKLRQNVFLMILSYAVCFCWKVTSEVSIMAKPELIALAK